MFWCIVGIDHLIHDVIDAIESNNDKVSQIVYAPPLYTEISNYILTPLDDFSPWVTGEKYFSSGGVSQAPFQNLKLEYESIIHKTAWVPKNVQYGKSNFFGAGVVIATNVKMGNFNWFNRLSSIGHDTVIGNKCIFSPGCTVCGTCVFNNNCIVGAGATVREGLSIHEHTFVAAGSILVEDTTDGGTYMGVPAKKVPCTHCPNSATHYNI